MIALSVERIKPLLPEKGKGIDLIIYDSIDSTNTEAKRLFEKGKNNMLICAEKQTAGRGRQGKSFYSPEKTGVYFSLVLNRVFELNLAAKVTTAAAVAVAEAIEELTGKEPKIKWVNDIYIDNKKICGILTEAIPSDKKGYCDGLVTGIGINISTVDFPDEIKDIAGSLETESLDGNLLVSKICDKILRFGNDLENPTIVEKYKSRSLVLDKEITYEKDGETRNATAIDIDNNCSLVIKNPDGKILILTSGEVSIKVK